MPNRVVVSAAELASSLRIWLVIASQRRPSLLRDLWTRRGEDYDRTKIEQARHELTRHLADKMIASGWEVTRKEVPVDALKESGEWTGPGGQG